MKIFTKLVITTSIALLSSCATHNQGLTNQTNLASTGTLPSQVQTLGALAGMAGSANNIPAATGQTAHLTNLLVQQLGVTPAQATGGAGSIFSIAKQSLSPDHFNQVSQSVPGIDQYLKMAPNPSTSTSLIGAAGSLMGGSGGSLANLALLASSFQSLGLNSGMVSQFIPIILQYVQAQGGANTMGLLQNVLTHQ